jgi:phosphoglycerate dehydrogenase-like enzyme
MGMILTVVRKIAYADRALRNGATAWNNELVAPVPRLANSVLGVIGLGRIGTATALRAKAFKLRVVACDPYVPPGRDKALGVELMSLRELLSVSDIISLHTPLTDETRHLIGPHALRAMKPGSVLVNTSRGAVVDLPALAEALRSGHLAGAGIDVMPVEPPEAEHPLISLWKRKEGDRPPNLVITPHIAFYSVMGITEIHEKATAEIARVLGGDKPRNPVNVEHFVPRA